MMKFSRRTVLQAAAAAFGAALMNSTVSAGDRASARRLASEQIVREGETVVLAPGHYGRVILDGGRLHAPSDVRIDELVFHSGSLSMPRR